MSRASLRSLFLLITLTTCLLYSACGKKGAPRLPLPNVPPPVTGLSAIHREGSIRLSWDFPKKKAEMIGKLLVMRSVGGDFETVSELGNNEKSYSDRHIGYDTHYIYKIRSVNKRDNADSDSVIIAITPKLPPSSPAHIHFEIINNKVRLKWKSDSPNILFNVYRSSEGDTKSLWEPAHNTPLTEPFFEDALSLDRIVHYSVRGLLDPQIRDEGPVSDVITVNPSEFIPSAPQKLEYFAAEDRVYLFWQESPETWVKGYRIYRLRSEGNYDFLGESQTPVFIDMHPANAPANYRISALGPAKEGPFTELKGTFPSTFRSLPH